MSLKMCVCVCTLKCCKILSSPAKSSKAPIMYLKLSMAIALMNFITLKTDGLIWIFIFKKQMKIQLRNHLRILWNFIYHIIYVPKIKICILSGTMKCILHLNFTTLTLTMDCCYCIIEYF